LPELQGVGEEWQNKRVAARFAVLALADVLATNYGVNGWAAREAIRAAAVGFAAWQALHGAGRCNAERDQLPARISSFHRAPRRQPVFGCG
jgi:putative DNA primase/helicase